MKIYRTCFGLGAVIALLGCATAPKTDWAARAAEASALIRAADSEIERGCYACLRSAAEKYEAAVALGGEVSAVKVAGAWVLVAARERELGLQPAGAWDRAKSHAVAPVSPPPTSATRPTSEIVEAYLILAAGLPHRYEGVSKETLGGAAAAARAMVGLIQKEAEVRSLEMLRERALSDGDRVAEYLLRSFACTFVGLSTTGGGEVKSPVTLPDDPKPSNLMAFLGATCGPRRDPKRDSEALGRLLADEPRFHEANYFLGRLRLMEKMLVFAERDFLAAANGVPRMTAAWAMLGTTRLQLEEYDWAAADLARALDIEPRQREVLLSHAKALNYAGRYEEALVPAQRLIDYGAWHVSDANFWLAFSELQLSRLQDADRHVREAKRTNPMNGDTARLSGLVAYHLAEFDRARTEFELAISRNAADCEAHLHLGMVHGKGQRFEPSVVAFLNARNCYSAAAASAESKRGEIDGASLSEARKETARARLEQRIRALRLSQATAALGAAEGEAQRGAYEAALRYVREAENASELGGRVSDLRTRIAALKARR